MAESPKHFLLVGNGPYTNRGCEAILRGTMAILRREFGEDVTVTLASFGNPALIADQAARETDEAVSHVCIADARPRRWTPGWWVRQFQKAVRSRSANRFRRLDPFIAGAAAALEVGGDNYSLDYGIPGGYIAMDLYLGRFGLPVVLWGASVGPFEAEPDFAPKMFTHLRSVSGVFVRESASLAYLQRNDVSDNVFRTCDPAFVMEPVEPEAATLGFEIRPGTIGLNFSPLMAKYAASGDDEKWIDQCTDIVVAVGAATGHDILLIPHVTSSHDDDRALLRTIADRAAKRTVNTVACLEADLSAAETKWVISRCAVFAGARTHATIAALSTCVPTLSFGYSTKARGISGDVYGTMDYCLEAHELSPSVVAARVSRLLGNADDVRALLRARIPDMSARAYDAGRFLRPIIRA